jgi:ABC-2 type transport system permease protein
MNPAITRATAVRVLAQLRHDPRTIAMLVAVPALLVILLRYMLNSQQAFDHTAPMLLGLFPFVVMFLVTSVATLRERRSGTLERLMTMPMAKLDFLLGYGVAFAAIALVQVAVVATITLTWLGLTIAGNIWMLVLATVLSALLGTALGLAVSAFAKSEFQAVQFMPVFVLPQALLCGLFVPARRHGPMASDHLRRAAADLRRGRHDPRHDVERHRIRPDQGSGDHVRLRGARHRRRRHHAAAAHQVMPERHWMDDGPSGRGGDLATARRATAVSPVPGAAVVSGRMGLRGRSRRGG